jgi:hypothetical protein
LAEDDWGTREWQMTSWPFAYQNAPPRRMGYNHTSSSPLSSSDRRQLYLRRPCL